MKPRIDFKADSPAAMRAMLALQAYVNASDLEPSLLALYCEVWSEPGALSGMLNAYRALLRYPPRRGEDLRITVPTLIVWGARDRYAGAELAQASVKLCEHGTLFWLDRASHWVQHDEPEQVARLCRAFLGRRVLTPEAAPSAA